MKMANIHDDCFIVMSKHGIQRMTKRPGTIQRGEIAVKVRLVVPTSAFVEPAISVSVTVPETAILQPNVTIEALPVDG
jgi:hypothetical protein